MSGPPDHLRARVPVTSSTTATTTSSIPLQSPKSRRPSPRGDGDSAARDDPYEIAGTRSTDVDRAPLAQRSLGVHSILNPAAAHNTLSSMGLETGLSTPEQLSPNSGTRSRYESNPPTKRMFTSQGSNEDGQRYETSGSRGNMEPSGGPVTGRGSPSTVPSWSPLSGPRRFLTPRSPRASSLSNVQSSRRADAGQPQYGQANPVEHIRSGAEEMGMNKLCQGVRDQSVPPQAGNLGSHGERHPSMIPPMPASTETSSQPMLGGHGTAAQHLQLHQPGSNHPQRPHVIPVSAPYLPAAHSTGRSFSPRSSGDSRWPKSNSETELQRTGGMKRIPLSDSAPMMMFATPGGEAIPIIYDTVNASRQADEKRLRNAGASARFRARKKDKDMQKDKAISRLEDRNRDLEKRLREMESEKEAFRADRDRLREVVRRTPSIADLAYQGPSSPSTRSVGSLAEKSPLGPGPPPTIPPAPYGVVDHATGERPSRRRRTGPQVEFNTPPYGNTLPHPAGYSPLPQPGGPSAAGHAHMERLPPLRVDQPMGIPSTMSETGPAMMSVRSYSPFKREPYESGWVTRSSRPPDPSPPR